MHSSKTSVIITLIIIAISIFLLVVYSSKQGKHTFSFIKSLYNEIRADQTSVSVRMDCETQERSETEDTGMSMIGRSLTLIPF